MAATSRPVPSSFRLLTPTGCAGVLALELRHGGERLECVRAAATILAAQLATLVSAPVLAEAVGVRASLGLRSSSLVRAGPGTKDQEPRTSERAVLRVNLLACWLPQGRDTDHRTAMVPFAAIFLLTLTTASSGPAATAVARPATASRPDVRLLELAAIRRLVNALARQRATMTEGERAAAWADFSLVSQAVIGDSKVGPFDLDELAYAATSGGGPRVATTPGVAIRDMAAFQLLALGYPRVRPPMS